jgi:hypothetical protein
VSRLYRVRVSESVTRVVHVGDAVASDLEILPILEPNRTAELLAAELGARGFARDGGVMRREEKEGITVAVDLGSGRVTVEARTGADVTVEVAGDATAGTEARLVDEARRVRDKLGKSLDKELAVKEDELRQATTRRLEGRLRDLRGEMDQVVARVTVEALKERARQLGEIEELHEDAETGELTIKVRV